MKGLFFFLFLSASSSPSTWLPSDRMGLRNQPHTWSLYLRYRCVKSQTCDRRCFSLCSSLLLWRFKWMSFFFFFLIVGLLEGGSVAKATAMISGASGQHSCLVQSQWSGGNEGAGGWVMGLGTVAIRAGWPVYNNASFSEVTSVCAKTFIGQVTKVMSSLDTFEQCCKEKIC